MSIPAAIIAALIVGWLLIVWMNGRTKTVASGIVQGQPAGCPVQPNCVSSTDSRPGQRVDPIGLDGNSHGDEVMAKVKQAASSLPGGRLVAQDSSYCRFVFTSRWLRFRDDMEFQLEDGTGLLHIRSASRVGYSDLGVNRRRVETFRKRFRAILERADGDSQTVQENPS